MRVEIGIPGATSQTLAARSLRDSITAAFSAEGQTVDAWSDFVARGAIDSFTAVLVTVVLAPLYSGAVYDAEKAALRGVLAAIKRVMAEHGVGVITTLDRPDREPVVYWIPSRPEGDLALDALDADYDADPPAGPRYWWPGIGWMTQREMIVRQARRP